MCVTCQSDRNPAKNCDCNDGFYEDLTDINKKCVICPIQAAKCNSLTDFV